VHSTLLPQSYKALALSTLTLIRSDRLNPNKGNKRFALTGYFDYFCDLVIFFEIELKLSWSFAVSQRLKQWLAIIHQ
jgi:hypothetical protein